MFISSNDRYSPIKLCSVTGLLYNFVTNQRLPMESLELHKGCPWDNLSINWGEVTLANGDTQVRLSYNVQIPMKKKGNTAQSDEKSRLHSTPHGPPRVHMVYSWHYPPSLPSSTTAFFPRVYEPFTLI